MSPMVRDFFNGKPRVMEGTAFIRSGFDAIFPKTIRTYLSRTVSPVHAPEQTRRNELID